MPSRMISFGHMPQDAQVHHPSNPNPNPNTQKSYLPPAWAGPFDQCARMDHRALCRDSLNPSPKPNLAPELSGERCRKPIPRRPTVKRTFTLHLLGPEPRRLKNPNPEGRNLRVKPTQFFQAFYVLICQGLHHGVYGKVRLRHGQRFETVGGWGEGSALGRT